MWRSAIGAVLAVGVLASGDYEGDKPYCPSKAEWFAVEMNCLFDDGGGNVTVHFVPRGAKMLIRVVYIEDDERESAVRAADIVESRAKQAARNRGWDGWLEYDVRIEKLKS
jgi:hypothetical protein